MLYSLAAFLAALIKFSSGLNLKHGEVSSGYCNFIASKFDRVPSSLKGGTAICFVLADHAEQPLLPCITVWQNYNQLCHKVILKMAKSFS